MDILNTVLELFKLTGKADVLWTVLPLAIATIVMVVYFQKYREERPGWNDYVANSLVLLFVAMALLRHIYELNIFGFGNYLEYSGKTIAVIFMLLIGGVIVRLNFEHILPEAVSRHLSSPLTVNSVGYVIVLYVHTTFENSIQLFISLLIVLLVILGILNLIKWPLQKLFDYMKKQKEREEIKNVKQEKFEIEELKKQLQFKKDRLEKKKLKDVEKQKKNADKIKKIIKSKK